ncbi:MAG: gamma-glutamyltransferase [Alphaproteobacteria bacterium]
MARTITRSKPVYSREEVESDRGVVAAGHEREAEAGARVLAAGGNAVDAMVAAAFTGFVVEPASCGVGGYAHTTVWIEKRGESITFDGYVRAPSRARADMFEIDTSTTGHYYGHPMTKGRKAEAGFLSPAVPGAVRSLCDAHEAFGKLSLSQVLEPAIEAAEEGLRFTWQHLTTIVNLEDTIRSLPETAAMLLPGGRLPRVPYSGKSAQRLDQTALAGTLKEIAKKGAAGFHAGRVAEAIGRFVTANGGILSADDIKGYRTRILREKPSRYRGHRYTRCFDQVAYEALNILDAYDLRGYGPDSYEYRHLAAEALALAFTDSIALYGDPDFEKAPVNGLASEAFADARRKLIRMGKAQSRPVAVGDPWPYDDRWPAPERLEARPTTARRDGTSQMVAADRWGNMASTIVSLTSGFGCLVLEPKTGVFLNNSMQNYDPRPDHPNRIVPGKMPIFAAPAIVAWKGGKARFAGAGSGGYRIEGGVLHTMMNVLDHRMGVQQAIDHPRVHSQGAETVVDDRIPTKVRDKLANAGHDVQVVREEPGAVNFGRITAIAYNPRRKTLTAGAAPNWGTGVAAI